MAVIERPGTPLAPVPEVSSMTEDEIMQGVPTSVLTRRAGERRPGDLVLSEEEI